MKFKLKNTPEQCELIKAMGSRDKVTAENAKSTFAALIGPTIDRILPQIDTTSKFYSEFRFDEGTDPSLPVEPFLTGHPNEELTYWIQNRAGGLPSNYVTAPVNEIKFSIYNLTTAISWDKKFAAYSRLDIISKYMERLIETLIIQTNLIAWTAMLTVLATASYGGVASIKRTITDNVFTLDDLSKWMTRMRRQNMSWANGSTNTRRGKITDIYISPEVMEQIRDFAYQPINTKVANKITPAGGDGDAAGTVTLPEGDRAKFFTDAENQSIFNVNIHEMVEFGVGQTYNNLFDELAASTSYTKPDGSGGAVFGANDELIMGVDTSEPFAYRAVSQDPDTKSSLVFEVDDQFPVRAKKIGYYASIDEGRVILSGRALQGLVI